MKTAKAGRFLCQARKKFARSQYVIQASGDKHLKDCIGNLRKTSGSNYVLYDNGADPKNRKDDQEVRAELMSIDAYNQRDHEVWRRRFDIIIPGSETRPFKPLKPADGIKNSYKSGDRLDVILFADKRPVWDPKTKKFKLPFNGKAKVASAKNIQIVSKR